MSTIQRRESATDGASSHQIDTKLEVVVIPVSDVDRSKAFYAKLGWRLDADFSGEGWRVIQFTPPGSPASVIFGKNVTSAAPGSAQGLYLVVSDIEAARREFRQRGVDVGDVFHADGDVHVGRDEPYLLGSVRKTGLEPARASYRSYASFKDPDGNGWLFQEVTTRLPGRVGGSATFGSQADLAAALRRASSAHGEHEKRDGGRHDANWPDWYAEYMLAEQSGTELPR
ncbi:MULTISPECIES: VOC family protein [unclassified Bradyrhizobium]|uniref:VOC family protein n=1 Tax=unclassified Bradyrhizobium TaxID=2631580 RepID=UPI001FF80FF5|nr:MULTISPECIES: VOC family protein [unclassified Bradyrhizobium]MCK1537519.1 VOC family protein [Bradyrhizobium sp. 176]MCK1554907.1 VOC family protein [Bradyrhizobium sp. 171]UPJ28927.1 VOC family protein [Bradyrhizobium sp. CW1]